MVLIDPRVFINMSLHGNEKQKEVAKIVLKDSKQHEVQTVASAATTLSIGLKRTVYDAKGTFSHDNSPEIVRNEGDPQTGDAAVNEVYDYAGMTYNFYKEVFNRNSLDNKGIQLDLVVHYGENYANSFWDGAKLVCGDGDGQTFQRFTQSIDIIGHELTHGILYYDINPDFYGQSGELAEHFCDVFGCLIKQYHHKETVEQANWLVGEGIFAPQINANAIRSIKAPGTAYNDTILGKDPQVAHMNNYKHSKSESNTNMFINSGIPNRAFYLVALELGGYAWEKAGSIWYKAFTEMLGKKSTFQDAR